MLENTGLCGFFYLLQKTAKNNKKQCYFKICFKFYFKLCLKKKKAPPDAEAPEALLLVIRRY